MSHQDGQQQDPGRAPLRAAIVGTGAVAHLHAQAVEADPRIELVAVSNRSESRRTEFADRYGVPGRYATHTELLAAERLDLVILCTPPDLHRQQTLDAYAAGVHVLCEKPPALSLAELDDMQQAADAAGLAFAIVFQQRTGTAAAHVKHLLDSGALGRPLLAQCQTLWLRGDDYYAVDWRGTWDGEGGGTTLGHGIHQMDLLAHLLGDWAEVDARLWRVARDIEMEDVSTAVVRFANGVVAQAVSSVLSPREASVVRIDCELATVEVEHLYGHAGPNWRITPARGVPEEVAAGWAFPAEDEPSGHEPLVRAVVDALWAGEPMPDLVTHARRPLELVTAIYASATYGKPVTPADLDGDERFRTSLEATITDIRP
ncbi:Gfo/Idh/MocA family protein [Cellulomonas sp. SLBN-39]|uniref:Gfo/Idh/MocA family protein n=1 Tax=Cellulomonas sp. SLBN-39 TaxID=2768446 RepID=UPI001152E5CF|nr:Gfo/Idh/MocA family oxidoreductase [Cellulomonas sp. SLBN-39]TQL02925.1 putative dehydrogenase [Cellulomonas sp. SLBN-39]